MTQATWAGFAGFANGVDAEATKSAFNNSLGGAYFDTGVHEVKIASVEPKVSRQNNLMLAVTFEGGKGENIKSFIPLLAQNRTDNTVGPHFKLSKLLTAITGDTKKSGEFFMAANENPALFGALTGLAVRIEITAPTKGYKVERNEDGTVTVVDIEKNEPYDVLAPSYTGYAEAAEAAKEANIQRGYNEVKGQLRGSSEDVARNQEALSEALRSATENVSPITAKASAARRPASI